MASSTTNPTVTISNQSGVDVEIFDVYNPNPGGQKGIYTYTSLGTIQNGAQATLQTLHFASQLQAFYTGQVAAINNNYYEKFPVAVLAVNILKASTLNQTITADDKTGMEQAFLFARYSGANADSKLTQQFVTALSNKDDQDTAVDAFFAGTANFSKASMSAWSAIMSWQSQFLSAWQGPYYLYQNDTSAKTIKLIAVVVIKSSTTESSAKLYIANQDGSYTTASQNVDVVQAGDGTINETGVGTSSISLTLTPVWMSISTVSPQGAVSYAIGGAMSGTVNGIQVMGTGQTITVPSGSGGGGSSSGSWYDTFSKYFSTTLSTIGMLTSMGMLFIMFKQWRGEKTQKSNDIVNKSPDPKANADAIENEKTQAEAQIDGQHRSQAEQQVASTQTDVEQLSGNSQEITRINQEIEARETIEAQTDKISDLLAEAPPSDLTEQAVSDVMASETALQSGDVDGAFKSLGDAANTTAEMAQQVESGMTEAQRADAEAVKQDVENSQEVQDTLQEKQEEQEKLNEQDPTDEIPKDKLTDESPADPPFEGGE